MAKNIFQALNIQPKRTTNEQSSNTFINNYRNSVSGPQAWDDEMISEALEDRWAGLDKSEDPLLSFDVDIPSTRTVRNIQSGRYRLKNNTNLTGLNNDAALYIIGNTYQENDDGTYYGMGWDGRPYSYTIKHNNVGDFTPLGVDEQKKAINRLSNGKISIHETITNPATLAEIYRSVKRMNDYGKGNLIPDHVVIGDSEPGHVTLFGGDGIMGIARGNGGAADAPDHIDLLGSDFPSVQAGRSDRAKLEGWFSAGRGDAVPQHELSHTAEFALLNSPQRYYNKVVEEAEKYRGKYSAEDLWDDAIGKVKYALPVLMDKMFGTHFVPSEDELYALFRSDKLNDRNMAEYWYDYHRSPKRKYDTVEEKMEYEARDKINELTEKYSEGRLFPHAQTKLFEQAAKNTGFDSVEDAMASVSEYATTNETEAFAEAYTDVLINGAQAKPFSKELIRLYSEVADDAAKLFGKNKPTQMKMLDELTGILPKDYLNNPRKQLNRFQQNYRLFGK